MNRTLLASSSVSGGSTVTAYGYQFDLDRSINGEEQCSDIVHEQLPGAFPQGYETHSLRPLAVLHDPLYILTPRQVRWRLH